MGAVLRVYPWRIRRFSARLKNVASSAEEKTKERLRAAFPGALLSDIKNSRTRLRIDKEWLFEKQSRFRNKEE